MKILMVAPGPYTRGGIVSVLKYYRSHKKFWTENNIEWIATANSSNKFSKLVDFGCALIIYVAKLYKTDLVHFHFTTGSSSNRKLSFFVLAKLFGKKTVSHIHAPSLNFTNNISYSFSKIVKDSDSVIVLSNIWRLKMNEIIQREYIILNNPSRGFNENICKKENIILFAGKLEERKGYLDLLKAFKSLDSRTDYKLILAGNGEVVEANRYIKSNRINNAFAIGWQDEDEMSTWFSKASIFILPSYAEGFPISLIDALSNSCAVVVTPVGGIPDLMDENINCLYVTPGDVMQIENALWTLIEDPDFKEEISLNGFELAKKSFDLNVITGQLTCIYIDLVGTKD